MVFSSPIFLFGFLPLVLLFYYLTPKKFKNFTLLFSSLIFYAWGEVFYLFIMLFSIIINYYVGIKIFNNINTNRSLSKLYLIIGVSLNILLLVSYKYANFIVDNINIVLAGLSVSTINLKPVHLPLGISFFTFQALSYIVDVYRKEVEAQRSVFNLGLYISLFPQLIAGPIVRYHDVAIQILHRKHTSTLFSSGIQRFIYGLAKKMLIANSLGEVADIVFSTSNNDLTMPLAWIGIVAYSLQIYFDFSGYSDMAIGLGRMFGFTFLENFNYPYISTSVREFWRRWHISLSTWFRDYVYIPLGGSRVPTVRVYINLLLVFILTGFWHGASWNFLVWGLFHGIFLALEHAGASKYINKLWRPIQHIYLLFVVLIGWVFFRADNLSNAIKYIQTMFNLDKIPTPAIKYAQIVSNEVIFSLLFGLILSMPIFRYVKNILEEKNENNSFLIQVSKQSVFLLMLGTLFYLSIIKISASTYNPFIYFRF